MSSILLKRVDDMSATLTSSITASDIRLTTFVQHRPSAHRQEAAWGMFKSAVQATPTRHHANLALVMLCEGAVFDALLKDDPRCLPAAARSSAMWKELLTRRSTRAANKPQQSFSPMRQLPSYNEATNDASGKGFDDEEEQQVESETKHRLHAIEETLRHFKKEEQTVASSTTTGIDSTALSQTTQFVAVRPDTESVPEPYVPSPVVIAPEMPAHRDLSTVVGRLHQLRFKEVDHKDVLDRVARQKQDAAVDSLRTRLFAAKAELEPMQQQQQQAIVSLLRRVDEYESALVIQRHEKDTMRMTEVAALAEMATYKRMLSDLMLALGRYRKRFDPNDDSEYGEYEERLFEAVRDVLSSEAA